MKIGRRIGVALLLCSLTAAVVSAVDRPPLIDAAKNGDRETLRGLIQKGANVNAAEGDGTTALHWASYRDDLEGANLLLKAGAKVNAANDLGATPLWAASQNGSEAMVRRLLEAGANPNLALLAGETPLMVASRTGAAGVVDQLIAKGANVNAHGSRGQTALMWAVSEKHPEVVKVLLAHGVNINAKSDVWSQVMAVEPHGYLPYNRDIPAGGETALLFAARVGDLASAKLLIAAGANVNDSDAWKVSAVTLAAHSDFRDLAVLLLDKGAAPNVAPAGFNALHEAIMHRDEKLAQALVEHGINVNTPLTTWTPERRSAKDFNFGPELVGASPLWLAARFSQPNVVRMLLARGADANYILHGETVVQDRVAGYLPRKQTTSVLMAAVGMGGGTAWVQSERSERDTLIFDAVKQLVDAGADLNTKGEDGKTALDGARTLRIESVTKYLTDHGAVAGAPAEGGRGGRGGRGAPPA